MRCLFSDKMTKIINRKLEIKKLTEADLNCFHFYKFENLIILINVENLIIFSSYQSRLSSLKSSSKSIKYQNTESGLYHYKISY